MRSVPADPKSAFSSIYIIHIPITCKWYFNSIQLSDQDEASLRSAPVVHGRVIASPETMSLPPKLLLDVGQGRSFDVDHVPVPGGALEHENENTKDGVGDGVDVLEDCSSSVLEGQNAQEPVDGEEWEEGDTGAHRRLAQVYHFQHFRKCEQPVEHAQHANCVCHNQNGCWDNE